MKRNVGRRRGVGRGTLTIPAELNALLEAVCDNPELEVFGKRPSKIKVAEALLLTIKEKVESTPLEDVKTISSRIPPHRLEDTAINPDKEIFDALDNLLNRPVLRLLGLRSVTDLARPAMRQLIAESLPEYRSIEDITHVSIKDLRRHLLELYSRKHSRRKKLP